MQHHPLPFLAIAVVGAFVFFAPTHAIAVEGATAPYNEAVTIVNGKRVVEVAPLPANYQSAIHTFRKADGGRWVRHSVETEQGLMDCDFTHFYHPAACSPSDYGTFVRPRDWTVKMKGVWYACSGRAKPVQCISLVQDGKLRALGGIKE